MNSVTNYNEFLDSQGSFAFAEIYKIVLTWKLRVKANEY